MSKSNLLILVFGYNFKRRTLDGRFGGSELEVKAYLFDSKGSDTQLEKTVAKCPIRNGTLFDVTRATRSPLATGDA